MHAHRVRQEQVARAGLDLRRRIAGREIAEQRRQVGVPQVRAASVERDLVGQRSGQHVVDVAVGGEAVARFGEIALGREQAERPRHRQPQVARLQHGRRRDVAAGRGAGDRDAPRCARRERRAVGLDHVVHRGRVRVIRRHAVINRPCLAARLHRHQRGFGACEGAAHVDQRAAVHRDAQPLAPRRLRLGRHRHVHDDAGDRARLDARPVPDRGQHLLHARFAAGVHLGHAAAPGFLVRQRGALAERHPRHREVAARCRAHRHRQRNAPRAQQQAAVRGQCRLSGRRESFLAHLGHCSTASTRSCSPTGASSASLLWRELLMAGDSGASTNA